MEAKIIFFFLILFANIIFLVHWFMGLIRGLLIKFAKFKPRLARRYCRCIGYVFRQANETLEVYIEEPLDRLRPLSPEEMAIFENPVNYIKHNFNMKTAHMNGMIKEVPENIPERTADSVQSANKSAENSMPKPTSAEEERKRRTSVRSLNGDSDEIEEISLAENEL